MIKSSRFQGVYWYKMKLMLIALVLNIPVLGQNLVPNGSFEDYYNCPTTTGEWPEIVDWESYLTLSADYFSECSDSNVVNVPYNQMGFQYAASGQAYVGVITYLSSTSWYREILGAELNSPLQIGVPTYLSMKVAVGGFGSWSPNSATYTCKGIGMKFFTTLPSNWFNYPLPNSADLYLDTVQTDTSSWLTLSGLFIPDSVYNYVVIANFFEDALSSPTILDSSGTGAGDFAYSFVDDICVSHSMGDCYIVDNVFQSSLATSITNAFYTNGILHLIGRSGITESRQIKIVDAIGRVVYSESRLFEDGAAVIEINPLPAGIYMVFQSSGSNSHVPVKFYANN